jgi:transcriptional regulator with GAF, ATPase, and Fis domain
MIERLESRSPKMQQVYRTAQRVAGRDVTVLIKGETGTGKEVLANWIHAESPRRAKPLVRFNCAALPVTLAEAELFGHTRGAFTSADSAREGYFARASGGTLVLDEVGELPATVQGALLRATQSGEIQRVGKGTIERVDVRLIACTNRDLESPSSGFRRDLFYRLAVVELRVPPLRERMEDVAPLAREFARVYGERFGLRETTLPKGFIARLEAHSWPGNVRELESVVQALAATCVDTFLDGDWEVALRGLGRPAAIPGLRAELSLTEHERLVASLREHGGNLAAAARALRLPRTTLFDKLSKHGLVPVRELPRPQAEARP